MPPSSFSVVLEGRAADADAAVAVDGRAPAHAARGRAFAKKKCERGDGAEDAGRSPGKVCLSRKRVNSEGDGDSCDQALEGGDLQVLNSIRKYILNLE